MPHVQQFLESAVTANERTKLQVTFHKFPYLLCVKCDCSGTEGCDGDDSPTTETVDGEVEGEDAGETYVSTHEQDKFDRRWLMLNSAQILLENIPTPSDVQNSKSYLQTDIFPLASVNAISAFFRATIH